MGLVSMRLGSKEEAARWRSIAIECLPASSIWDEFQGPKALLRELDGALGVLGVDSRR
jgi:hypothetical protein